ncbi:hypothetical protein MtrunA17_Chr5g0442371 [Medicago truncatula]|uniref:Uncharacterized protein n=1 Tax=Medicago truncatula TaxID=3880 RepID=A0A072UH19_MEDTR|nr:hypothetical protein MTR_5g090345 [Medicago truncatula]RHN57614.1 hypothetical protein MtrunA17_Chr5g0442371 [Medicago truncatula]
MVTIKYTQIAKILGAVKPFESWFLITTMNHFMCSNVESRILNSFIMMQKQGKCDFLPRDNHIYSLNL